MIGNWKIYWTTGILIFCSIFIIIPNLSNNLSDYTKETKKFKNSRVDFGEKGKLLPKRPVHDLILTMEDGTEWKISSQYSEYWDELRNPKNVGKKFTFYSKTLLAHSNPSQIEIDNKVVYNLKTMNITKYMLLFITLIGCAISINDYRKYLKNKHVV